MCDILKFRVQIEMRPKMEGSRKYFFSKKKKKKNLRNSHSIFLFFFYFFNFFILFQNLVREKENQTIKF